jgi:hypothetical protein
MGFCSLLHDPFLLTIRDHHPVSFSIWNSVKNRSVVLLLSTLSLQRCMKQVTQKYASVRYTFASHDDRKQEVTRLHGVTPHEIVLLFRKWFSACITCSLSPLAVARWLDKATTWHVTWTRLCSVSTYEGVTARVFRSDSPGKAAQWLARSVHESWGVLWLVIRLLSVRADVSSSVIKAWECLYCIPLHTCQRAGTLPVTTRTSPTPRRRTVTSKYSSFISWTQFLCFHSLSFWWQ